MIAIARQLRRLKLKHLLCFIVFFLLQLVERPLLLFKFIAELGHAYLLFSWLYQASGWWHIVLLLHLSMAASLSIFPQDGQGASCGA